MIRCVRAAALAVAAILTVAAVSPPVQWSPDLVHSRAEFTVSHMVLWKVWGHVPIRLLRIETPPDSVIPQQIDAVLDVTHEDTDNHDRDADLRSETYFDVAHYPTISFHSSRIVQLDFDDAEVAGTITMKNVMKTITFPIHVVGRIPDSGGTRVGFTGQFHIGRRDFGIVDNRLTAAGVLLVGYDVTIGLTAEATTLDPRFSTAERQPPGHNAI